MNEPELFKVQRGLVQGYRCPISNREFVSIDPTENEQLRRDCLAHTMSIMYAQDGTEPKERSLQSRQNLHRSQQ